MHVAALDEYLCAGCIEVLVLQFAHLAAVHRVGPFAAEFLDVEEVSSCANLLVGIESDANLAVLDFRMRHQVGHRSHNLSNSSLIVSAKKCVAVSDDEVLADVLFELRELADGRHDAIFLAEHDVPSIVVLDDARLDVLSAAVGACVHVGDEADCGHLLVGIGRQSGIDVAVLVHLDFREAKCFQLVAQVFSQSKLLLCARALCFVLFATLRIEANVLQKSFN